MSRRPFIRRILTGACLAGFLAVPHEPRAADAKGNLSGTVVDQFTGAPLSKATVRLRSGYPELGKGCTGNRTYNTLTGADGAFAFADLPPDCYQVSVERASYAPMTVGTHERNTVGSMTAVRAGERLQGIGLKIAPQGLIAGRVLSEDGTPFRRVTLLLLAPAILSPVFVGRGGDFTPASLERRDGINEIGLASRSARQSSAKLVSG